MPNPTCPDCGNSLMEGCDATDLRSFHQLLEQQKDGDRADAVAALWIRYVKSNLLKDRSLLRLLPKLEALPPDEVVRGKRIGLALSVYTLDEEDDE